MAIRTGLTRTAGGYCILVFAALVLANGCAHRDQLPLSSGHLGLETPAAPAAVVQNIPPPVRIPAYVPPPKPQPKQQTFSIVVHETPVKDLLFALARDSKLNVDVHPNIQGLVTLNAINETLPAILDRIKKQVNLRYAFDGGRLSVVPDTPFVQTYRVDYVNIARSTTSSVGVSGQIATGVSADTASGNAQAAANSSNTSIQSTSNNNFWEVLLANIRMLLRSTSAVTASAEERSSRGEAVRAAREEKIAQAEAASRAGTGAQALFNSAFAQTASADGGDDAVVVNSIAGTVSVLATERQHVLVKKYLDEIGDAAQRQVLIEATIVEVRLNDRYQAGVDWSRLAEGTGFSLVQSTLGGRISAPPNFTIGYSNKNSDRTINAAIRLLESFGTARVLSSPKLMTLNNQTALLQVVDQVVYFTLRLDIRDSTNLIAASRSVFTSQVRTVPVGVVMAVTPQIGADHAVTLNVRPSVSRITRFVPDPAPGLNRQLQAGNPNTPSTPPSENLIPEIQIREMESVLQVQSGQTVILGGLMQNDTRRIRDGIPVLSKIPELGDVFSTRDEDSSKTELVIFLRPTVITNASLASDALRTFQQFLPGAINSQNADGVK